MEIILAQVSNGSVRNQFQTIKQFAVNRSSQKNKRNPPIYEAEGLQTSPLSVH